MCAFRRTYALSQTRKSSAQRGGKRHTPFPLSPSHRATRRGGEEKKKNTPPAPSRTRKKAQLRGGEERANARDGLSNEKLLSGLRKGEQPVVKYVNRLAMRCSKSYLRNNKGNEVAAERIAEISIEVLIEKVKRKNFIHKNIEAWIKRTINNLWHCHWKKPEYIFRWKKDRMDEDAKDALKVLIPKLKFKSAKILRLFYLENRRLKYIARVMKYSSANSAKVMLCRARRELKRVVKGRFSQKENKEEKIGRD